MSAPHDHTHNLSLSTINRVLSGAYLPAIWQNTYAPNRLIDALEAPPMTIEAKIAAERREARERAAIELLYRGYDNDIAEPVRGDMIRFQWAADSKIYDYAAIFVDNDRWYLTGGQSPQGLTHDQLIDWLVAKRIANENVTWITS